MLLEIHPRNPDERKLKMVNECLKDGGVIIYPTDTVYSFGCDINSNKAIERVARLRGVKVEKANFSIVCSDLSHITEYSKPVDNHIFKLMKRLLPGPYTFILEANRNLPRIFSEKKKTIGIRVPDNPIALSIVATLGNPIIATSVHDDNEIIEYTTDAFEIHEKFEKLVDIVIDGGPVGFEVSTVLNCVNGQIELVRLGKGPVDFL